MENILIRSICFFTLLGVAAANCVAEFVIDASHPTTVVISDKPSETERFAADELVRYIKQITGVKLERASQSEFAALESKEPLHFIAVGRNVHTSSWQAGFSADRLSPQSDAFVIDVSPQRIAIVGACDRATLYGVYELLYQSGCRWFFPGELGEVLPRRIRMRFASQTQMHQPAFVQREMTIAPPPGVSAEAVVDWMVKNRLTRNFSLRNYHLRQTEADPRAWQKRGGYDNWQQIAHNFHWMLPSDQYFKSHPEYYSLYKGTRIPLGTKDNPTMGGGNLCTSNSDVVDRCAAYCNDWFDKHPTGAIVPIWPGDGAVKWCECEACCALGGKNFTSGDDGSMTRRLVKFANQIAAKVAVQHPDRMLLLPAYSNYVAPVESAKIADNILVQYCFHGCYAHGLDCPHNQNAAFEINTWSKQANGRIGVWDYFLIGDHLQSNETVSPAILPVIRRAQVFQKDLRQRGFRFYFTQTSSKYWRHNILAFYATARLMWDPGLNLDELIDDFASQMYGPSSTSVASFYKCIEASAIDSDWHPKFYSDVSRPSRTVYTDDVVKKLTRLVSSAERNATTPILKRRVQLLRESLDATLRELENASTPSDAEQALFAMDSGQFDDLEQRGLVSPISQTQTYVDGLCGQAAKYSGTDKTWYPFGSLYSNSGTIEVLLHPTSDELRPLISTGQNNPTWFQVMVSKQDVALIHKHGRSPYRDDGQFHVSLKCKVPKPEQRNQKWLHIAVVWRGLGPNRSLVQIFCNGELCEERANANINPRPLKPKNLGVGIDSASHSRPGFEGLIDELRVSNTPKSAEQIRSAYLNLREGRAFGEESSTLLLVHFDANAEAIHRTRRPSEINVTTATANGAR